MANKKTEGRASGSAHGLWVLLASLLIIFGVLFYKSFLPQYVLFNNDNPIGNWAQDGFAFPQAFTSVWLGLNWPGQGLAGMPPTLTYFVIWICGVVFYAKFWQAISMMVLGLCGWVYLRSLKFGPVTCVLGGLAFALHSDPFSTACWGQVSRPLALSGMLLALAALQNGSGIRYWLRALLAGLAVSWGIMEGLDVAALFSVVVGAYTLFQTWVAREGSPVRKLVVGAARLGLVAGFAGLVAASSISSLLGVAVTGVAGMGEETKTKAEQWGWATQWSLPKAETLASVIPGLFGYRMDTPEGGQYWGRCGSDLSWDQYIESGMQGQPPRGTARYMGSGNYAGVLVLMVGLWALLQSFRGKHSVYSALQKRFIWFWAVLAGGCVLLAWGRFAPFYQIFYLLPHASAIRNPVKFMHIVNWASLMLFAYGVHGLSQRMSGGPAGLVKSLGDQWKNWRSNSTVFDRRWLLGSKIALGVTLLGWLMYASMSTDLQKYLMKVQFEADSAAAIAGFSVRQVGWFVLYLTLSLAAVALVMSGYFSGRRVRWGAVILGLILVTDLGRANLPWIVHWDFSQKYASNPVIERLQEKAETQRVAILPEWIPGAFQAGEQAQGMAQYLSQLYRIEWAQHHFFYYNIPSLDVVQLPRPPVDYVAFEAALQFRGTQDSLPLVVRRWELTSTRCILGMTGFVDLLNQQFDPVQKRFRVIEQFNIVPKPGVSRPTKLEELTAELSTNGPYAMIEFTGALPRAKLYSNWTVNTNDEATLKELAGQAFDPHQAVLVSSPIPASGGTNHAGEVDLVSYAPKDIQLKADVKTPAVLLLNDRYDPNWKVTVDGKPAELLRCNYIMRGVFLEPGQHVVEFQFCPSTRALYVSLTAMSAGLVLLIAFCWVSAAGRHRKSGASEA